MEAHQAECQKNIFAHQRAASQTGGGTNEKRVSQLDWLVYSLVPHSFFEDSSQYDSDEINNDMGQIDSEIVNTIETGSLNNNRLVRVTASGSNENRIADEAHPQEIADSHIHQGARSVKTTNTTSLSGPLRAAIDCMTAARLKRNDTCVETPDQ
ncbi:hypothetical protein EVAR_80657_1 [Eumeta japonica]|uniref:Uncharacterized protein n=1 Tax=Eumeta variegata TaxID=151549 RepID=A0A4C1U3K2_EUMVA|nr:hypothetical protein EVAR_80657_1 [Eumeta japonica]